jgi:hypothetical protein
MDMDSKQIKGLKDQFLRLSQCTVRKCKDQTGGMEQGKGQKKIKIKNKK